MHSKHSTILGNCEADQWNGQHIVEWFNGGGAKSATNAMNHLILGHLEGLDH